MLVVHLLVDTRDAMGANLVNGMCEGIAPLVETITGGEVFLRILSNLTDRSLVRANCKIPLTQLAGRGTDVEPIELAPGETADLPDGLGSITFENEAPEGAQGYEESVKRYVSLSIHRDAAATWVLVFAVLATAGLLAALFVPRRRMWVKATPRGGSLHLEYAGLARGEDPTLDAAVAPQNTKKLTV